MQNLKTPPSTSASEAPINPPAVGVPPTSANGNGAHANGTQDNGHTHSNGTTHGVHKQHPKPDGPLLTLVAEVEALEHASRTQRRSLRMQMRYLRTIAFAGWMFVRVLFWYVYMARIFGTDFVTRGHTERLRGYAREFRHFAIALGGVHIKLGQFVSTRVDILPEAVVSELQSLQDEVPAIPFPIIRKVIERQLGDISQHFHRLSDTPIAAASLGQVYRGQLHNGDKVVVKVQRPGIRETCYTDLAALRVVMRIADRVNFIRRRTNAPALAEEFGHVLLQELSYTQEAHNAERFDTLFKDDLGVYIPSIYRDLSTDEVLVIEDVTTLKISDFTALDAAGISRKAVANRLTDAYFKQVFDARLFHADPHPGNLFVYPLPLEEGQTVAAGERPFYLIFIDFGMVSTLSNRIADGIVSTLAAVLARDPKRLVQSYQELGLLLPDADVARIEQATKATFDHVWGLSMSDIKNIDVDSVLELGREFNDLIYAMPFYLPQDFIYLGRALGILNGLATQLDPHFNPWQELQPYVQKMMAQGLGTSASKAGLSMVVSKNPIDDALGFPLLSALMSGGGGDALLKLGQRFVERTVNAPSRVGVVLEQLERGELRVLTEPDPKLKKLFDKLEAQGRSTSRAVVFGSLLMTATLFYIGGHWAGALVGYGGALLAGWALWSGD
jgi:predicted unusual protein kinase regulating ubiquinone biosynthesis (AarF/ABC1/UbiB family)